MGIVLISNLLTLLLVFYLIFFFTIPGYLKLYRSSLQDAQKDYDAAFYTEVDAPQEQNGGDDLHSDARQPATSSTMGLLPASATLALSTSQDTAAKEDRVEVCL